MRYPCTLLPVFRSASFSQAHAPPNARLFPKSILSCVVVTYRLCDELDDTTGLLDLALSLGGDVTGADDDGDVGETALAEDLGVAEGQEVEDGGRVGVTLAGEVLLALLGGNEGPELLEVDDGSPELVLELVEVAHTDLTAAVVVSMLKREN